MPDEGIAKSESLLSVRNLSVEFRTQDGIVKAVNDVSLELPAGKTLGLVGESGSGKSVTSLAIMQLIQSPPGRITRIPIRFLPSPAPHNPSQMVI